MKACFIADVHLSRDSHSRAALFSGLLERLSAERCDLYILGDLFEYWANNRGSHRAFKGILDGLRRYRESGARVYYISGNRDFLVRKDTFSAYGVAWLGESLEMVLQGRRVHLTHGYTLCTEDHKFLSYKGRVWPIMRFLDRLLPGAIEDRIAQALMRESSRVIASQSKSVLEVQDRAVERLFDNGIELVVCGHVHRAEVKAFGKEGTLVTLPAWEEDRCGLMFLEDGEPAFEGHPVGSENPWPGVR